MKEYVYDVKENYEETLKASSPATSYFATYAEEILSSYINDVGTAANPFFMEESVNSILFQS